jgi:putative nucleotide binding protein
VLDYLPQGHPDNKRFKREPIAFGLGESGFKILELIPKPDVILEIGERLYIGKDMDQRSKILHVKRRISYDEMTTTAKKEVSYIIEEIVKKNEDRFISFYNDAHAISTRFHMLELLPGLGKKTMWAIIDARKKAPFSNFEDMAGKVSAVHQPEKLICKRILLELSDPTQKYHLFVMK